MQAKMRQDTLIWNGVKVAKQPPWILRLCKTPDSGHVNDACGYSSTTCSGATNVCSTCLFSYCQKHFNSHTIELTVPRDATKTYVRRLYRTLNRRSKTIAELPPDLMGDDVWLA